jgi:hypothetical protein
MNYALYATQGKATDVTDRTGAITTKTNVAQQTLSNLLDRNSGKNPNTFAGNTGIENATQQAVKGSETVVDLSSQAPNKRFVIGYSETTDQFGNPKPILGKAKFITKGDGTQKLNVEDMNGKVIKSYNFSEDPVAAQDAWISDFGPYNGYNVFEAGEDVRSRPRSAAARIATKTLNK